jgi:hypothetical protein
MRLSVFDFDGTLVSPTGRWIDKTGEQVRKAVSRGDYTVVLTGRPGGDASSIKSALANKRLVVNEIIAVGPLNTLERKKQQIRRLIRDSDAEAVELWDDNAPMLTAYGRMLEMMQMPHALKWVK